ncbi:aspartate aminotransferase family protein [Emericellopsis cladophorae]|uniref:Aspartate aminotransferase family protein n=1 Tax=Emericellopsis cladophorae TaxID=2686198 RepID=A0A9P9Y9D6_9HYPO|nr:aspartate aminotransferase family protein [Emericellopsis cladophorae]KAI6785952.1 aspartate aminotransferase family protein [Emericellopsis cladophorae]
MSTHPLTHTVEAAKQRYALANPTSMALHEEATQSLPGGNTRTVLHADPFPIYMKSGKNHQVTSEDGKTYTDLLCEFTAALYGHSNPRLQETIANVVQTIGMNVGANTRQETLFAREVCSRFDLERVRFANSGTEANLHALAAARLFTGKHKVVSFSGGYHGGVLGFRGGVPAKNNVDKHDWVVACYNDLESARAAIKTEGVAAVVVEGMQGAGGCFAGTIDFLKGVQEVAHDAGVLFILDEVMTSRLSSGGLAQMYGLKPDLKTFGKWLGGGLAIGAFGGRADIMATFDPRLSTSVAHSGTFNNNTLVTHAGYTGLKELYTSSDAERFTQLGEDLRAKLNEVSNGTKMCFTGLGTIMAAHITKCGTREILRASDVEEDQVMMELFWFEMIEQGFWLAKRGFVALILETPQEELDRFVGAVAAFVSKYRSELSL